MYSIFKMVGSPLILVHRLGDHVPYLTWTDVKMNYHQKIQQYPSTFMPPKLLFIYNKSLICYLECTYTVPMKFVKNLSYERCVQILTEGLNHYTKVLD